MSPLQCAHERSADGLEDDAANRFAVDHHTWPASNEGVTLRGQPLVRGILRVSAFRSMKGL